MVDLAIDKNTRLRSVRMNDVSGLFALVDSNRSHLRQWLNWVDGTTSEESIRQFLKSARDQDAEGRGPVCCIVHRKAIVGICGCKPIDMLNRSVELGYWLAASVTGGGIMTRCVRALIDYLFREFDVNRIELRAATGNSRSRAVAERLPFTHEADLREAEWINDRFVDQAVYSILRHEWKSESAP